MIGIYKITNPEGKVYIGQSDNIKRRLRDHATRKSKKQTRLYDSFKKHGCENHVFEVVECCETSELNIKERYWQDYYNVLEYGLNCVLTRTPDKNGEGLKRPIHSMAMSGKNNPMFGKTHSDKARKNISEKKKGVLVGDKNPMYGVKRPELSKSNVVLKGKKIIDIRTNEVFDSIADAARKNSIPLGTLKGYLQGRMNNKTNLRYYENIP